MILTTFKTVASPANLVYILDALDSSEMQTGVHKYNQIVDEVLSRMPEESRNIKSKIFLLKTPDLKTFASVFEEIKSNCNSKMMPLIFIDGHGDKQKGLKLPSGEFVNWEIFNNYLE